MGTLKSNDATFLFMFVSQSYKAKKSAFDLVKLCQQNSKEIRVVDKSLAGQADYVSRVSVFHV